MNNVSQNGTLSECFDAASFTVYADFNCPFCYALNERLFAANLEYRVDFRLIQQSPEVHSERISLELLSELTAEVAEVRRRAPSTEINVPMFRPSSAAASALVYAIGRGDPVGAAQLRRRIYRALWVDAQDISKPEILAALLLELDIELPSSYYQSNGELTAWQSEWANNAEFDRNLPVLISERGETVIGFLLEPELDAFLEFGSLISDKVAGSLWVPQKRQRILVLDNDTHSLRMIVEQMHDAQVEVVEDFIGLITHARNFGLPDLVVVNTALIGNIADSDWWRNWTHSDMDPAIPIIHIADWVSTEGEAAAFAAGATDFIARPLQPKALRARLSVHLQARRALQQVNNIARLDALTAICNRREFDARLLTEWGRAVRAGQSLALLMIDVDMLKEFNDSYGHLRGDQCLVAVAQLLGGRLRRCGDLVARYGGGLFVVLLPDVEAEGGLKIARDCQQAISEEKIPHIASTIAPCVTVSIGVAAMVPTHEISCTLMIEEAEIALYQARQEGCNRVCVFDHGDCPEGRSAPRAARRYQRTATASSKR